MRVLLTGGYGCIGSWIVRNLLDRGDQVWIYDLQEDPRRLRLLIDGDRLPEVTFLQGDVTDLTHLRQAIDRNEITHVIHLAGLQVPTCRADPILGAKVNVVGTLTVFEAVRLARPQVERLVYASSSAVFGPQELYAPYPGPLPDDAPPVSSSHYGVFKTCNEGNARIYYQDFGLSSIGLRPWGVYGVGRDAGMTSEPTKAIKAAALGRPFAVSFGGTLDLQYVDDVAKTFIRCLAAPFQGAKAYNLRGAVVDLPTFRQTLIDVEPAAATLVTVGERQLGIAPSLDDSALQRDLGPMPVTPLAEGVRQTLEHFRKLAGEGRLDTVDLEVPPPSVTAAADEP